MAPIPTRTGERLLVHHHGPEVVALSVTDPRFGRVATVRLDHNQAVQLAATITSLLLDVGRHPAAEHDGPG